MKSIKNFFTRLRRINDNPQQTIDELSWTLILVSLICVLLLLITGLHRFTFFSWIPLILAYTRTFSKKKQVRFVENQKFLTAIKPISLLFQKKTTARQLDGLHYYFGCYSCTQPLRMPKKTGHVKVTCPKCNHSFVKKTPRGYVDKIRTKLAQSADRVA